MQRLKLDSKEKNRIICPNIILCEGMDEWSFLVNYLAFLTTEDNAFDTIQVINFGGISDLQRQFRQLIKMPDFSMVKSILIIRDAEKNPQGAKESICSTLMNNGFGVPNNPGEIIVSDNNIKVAYMLFPSCDENGDEAGTLEDLCLRIISEPDYEGVLKEIDNYIELMEDKYSKDYPRVHKNKLHLLISSYDKYVDAKAGEAGQRGLYDWKNARLNMLREVMYKLCLE